MQQHEAKKVRITKKSTSQDVTYGYGTLFTVMLVMLVGACIAVILLGFLFRLICALAEFGYGLIG